MHNPPSHLWPFVIPFLLGTSSLLCQTRTFSEVPTKGHLPPTHTLASTGAANIDFDGDGDLDVLAGAQFGPIAVWENDGGGFFEQVGDLGVTSTGAVEIHVGDLDLDGDDDVIAIVAAGSERRVTYFGNFGGTFGDVTLGLIIGPSSPTMSLPGMGAELVDLDADSDIDVVLDDGRVYANDGLGRLFESTTPLALGNGSFVFLDANGDSLIDLLRHFQGGTSTLELGDGTGSFNSANPPQLPSLPAEPEETVVFDLDGDSDLDIILPLRLFGNVLPRVWINDGTGLYTDDTAARLPASASARNNRGKVWDIDGDGDSDLVFSGVEGSFFRNNGAGFFSSAPLDPVVHGAVTRVDASLIFDADQNTLADLISLRSRGLDGLMWLQIEPAELRLATDSTLPRAFHTGAIVSADFTGDGIVDVANGVQLFRGLGDGTFSPPAQFLTPGLTGLPEDAMLAPCDLNNDGVSDLALAEDVGNTSQITLYLNDGTGTLTITAVLNVANCFNPRGFSTGDFNGDSIPDFVLGNAFESPMFLGATMLSQSPNSWTEMPLPEQIDTVETDLGDFDGDGDVDIFIASDVSNRILTNDGVGNFSVDPVAAALFDAVPRSSAALVVDIDLDGDVDVLAPPRLFTNNGSGGFADETSTVLPGIDIFGFSSLDAADFDGDGDMDLLGVRAGRPAILISQLSLGITEYADATAFVFGDDSLRAGDTHFLDVDDNQRVDVLASGTDGLRVLFNLDLPRASAPKLSRIGQPYRIEAITSQFAGIFNVALYSPARIDPIQTQFGAFALDPATTVSISLPIAAFEFEFVIPTDPSLSGMEMHWQLLRSAGPSIISLIRLTNLVSDVISN